MSAEETPFYFAPVRYDVVRTAEVTPAEEEKFISTSRSELSSDYFFNKVISENEEEFETIDVYSVFRDTIGKSIDLVEHKLRERLEKVTSSDILTQLLPHKEDRYISPYLIRRFIGDVPRRFCFHKNTASLIIPITSHTFYVISEDEKSATSLLEEIKHRFEQLGEITKDFGLKLSRFLTAQEYQNSILENLEHVKEIEFDKPQNVFEEEVIEACSKLTSSFLSNVKVQFDEPVESFEYDLFIGFTEKRKVIIEPTDYESKKQEIRKKRITSETLKSTVILATHDKAQRLKADSIVITNGFPDETFLKLKKIADSRGVGLMNEKNYKLGLPSALWRKLRLTVIPFRMRRIS